MQDKVERPGRRTFLKTSAAALATTTSAKRILGANDRVRVAVVGLNGRGWNHVTGYNALSGVELAAFCDVDENVLQKRIAGAEKLGVAKPQTFTDFRKVLEDKNIDAVSIATPNHWHSLQGIWAAQAGKDIYIEKPCSHNWWEGRQLVQAINKYKVICEHGSQCRSSAAIREAMDKMKTRHHRRCLHGPRALLQVASLDRAREPRTRAAGCSLRPVDRTRADEAFHEEPLPLQLALDLGHRKWRSRKPGHP